MSSDSQPDISKMAIISTDAITIHINGEPTVHIKHFFDINELEKVGLKLHETLLLCGVGCYFNKP